MKRNEKLLLDLVNGILQICSGIDEHKPTEDPSDVMIHALEIFCKLVTYWNSNRKIVLMVI